MGHNVMANTSSVGYLRTVVINRHILYIGEKYLSADLQALGIFQPHCHRLPIPTKRRSLLNKIRKMKLESRSVFLCHSNIRFKHRVRYILPPPIKYV